MGGGLVVRTLSMKERAIPYQTSVRDYRISSGDYLNMLQKTLFIDQLKSFSWTFASTFSWKYRCPQMVHRLATWALASFER